MKTTFGTKKSADASSAAAAARAGELRPGAIVLCDRGVCDSRAYLTAAEYGSALASNGLDERSALARYAAVFHLRTVALADPGSYRRDNNTARLEDADEASLADARTLAAWSAHPNLRVIGNEPDFGEKARNLVRAVMDSLRA